MRLSSKGPIAIAAAAALAFGCNSFVQGDGVYTVKYRDLPAFQGVRVENGLKVVATSGVALERVKVIGDQNVVPNIMTELDPDPLLVGTTEIQVLHVWVEGAYDPMITPQVVVGVPSFSYVEASDTSAVTVAGAGGDAIEAKLGGESLLDATEYLTTLAHVDLSGSSTANLNSSGPVTGTVANDSTLRNIGGPCDVTRTSGNPTVICPPAAN